MQNYSIIIENRTGKMRYHLILNTFKFHGRAALDGKFILNKIVTKSHHGFHPISFQSTSIEAEKSTQIPSKTVPIKFEQ